MQTFRLRLEQDPDIPRFKRLAFEKVKVPIADVLLRGIHPWMGGNVHPSLNDKFAEILNADKMKIAKLAQFGYCAELHCGYSVYTHSNEDSPFQATLQHVREGIRFVDHLSYAELLDIAKERLRRLWSHEVVRDLLSNSKGNFDAIRSFLKAKDKNIKLSGYEDLRKYDLSRILCLDDFKGDDAVIIRQGIPITNFRSEAFLQQVTDESGLLRLTDSMRDFQLITGSKGDTSDASTRYNCRCDGENTRMVPELDENDDDRERAKAHASCLRTDNGRYCFTSTIAKLAELLDAKACQVTFPTLDYERQQAGQTSAAKIQETVTPSFGVGTFLTANDSGEDIKAVLRNHGIPMTGRKEQLVEKLAQLAAKQYAKAKPALDAYFGQHRFVRAASCSQNGTQLFPILERNDLRNMLLTMYILRHLRGNTILEATHENDTYDIPALAKALLKHEVTLNGVFLRVE